MGADRQIRLDSRARTVRRVLGEVGVIVVSILLAFSLDAWWNNRLEVRETDRLLVALLAEFDGARAELDRVGQRHGDIVSAADEILAELRNGNAGAAPVRASAFAELLATTTLDPPRGTLDALIASGDLRLIRDQTLRSLLADWPAALADHREEDEAARSFVLHEFMTGLGPFVDLRPAFDERIQSGALVRGSQRGAAPPGSSSDQGTVSLPRTLDVISLIETRRFLSQFARFNLSVLDESFDRVHTELRVAIES